MNDRLTEPQKERIKDGMRDLFDVLRRFQNSFDCSEETALELLKLAYSAHVLRTTTLDVEI